MLIHNDRSNHRKGQMQHPHDQGAAAGSLDGAVISDKVNKSEVSPENILSRTGLGAGTPIT